ncbi:MAG: hypothetical protein R3A79_25445 [Nannocystaceae bacterium]
MTPRRHRRAVARAAERATRAAEALDLRRARDPEIDTTWRLEGSRPDLGLDLVIELGSTWQRTAPLRGRWSDWLRVAATRPEPWLPAGIVIRPARRTVWEWRDGLPGEAAQALAGGVLLRVEPPQRLDEVAAHLKRLSAPPHAAYPESIAGQRCVLRARPEPDAAPEAVLADLLALLADLGGRAKTILT